MSDDDALVEPMAADLQRVQALLRKVGGPSVQWGAASVLEVLLVEHQLAAQRKLSERLTRATWTLTGVTAVLALATIALIWATLAD